MNSKETKRTLAAGPVIFILCCVAVALFVFPRTIHRYDYYYLIDAYSLQCGVIGGFLLLFHFVLSCCNFTLKSVNAWFCILFPLLMCILMYSWPDFDLTWSFVITYIIAIGVFGGYCGAAEVNRPLVVIMFFSEVAYSLHFFGPEWMTAKYGWLYYACNGIRAFAILLAVIHTISDVATTIRIAAEESRKKRAQQAAEREAKHRAERLEKLPKEINEMQPYSLNILPFINAMSGIGSTNADYSRTCEKLSSFAMQLEKRGQNMNEEALELGLSVRTSVHSK